MRKPGIFPPAELCCSVVAARRPTDLPTLFLKVGIAVSLRVFYTTGFIFQSYEIKCNYRHFRPDLWLFADVILWCEGEICGCVSGWVVFCASAIADHLNAKRTVVLNLESTNKEVSRRLVDFLSGVAYANNGQIKRVANSTFIITPYNVDIMGDLLDELESNGVFF